MDLVLCLLLVPVPLFPVLGALSFGVLAGTVDPHYLVVRSTNLKWSIFEQVQVALMFFVGNLASSIKICFHFRYETVLSAAGAQEKVSIFFVSRIVSVLSEKAMGNILVPRCANDNDCNASVICLLSDASQRTR